MITTTIDYILKYVNPDRTVEGPEKTRIFQSEHKARVEIEGLDRHAPNAHSIQLIKQTTTQKRETII